MIRLSLIGVRVEVPTNQPIVLLREEEGTRFLPIFIGSPEATAIVYALQGLATPRPLTHDLFKTVLDDLSVKLDRVEITKLHEGTFYAEIELDRGGAKSRISSRPVRRHRARRPLRRRHPDLRRRRRARRGRRALRGRRRGAGSRPVPPVPRRDHPRRLRAIIAGRHLVGRPRDRGGSARAWVVFASASSWPRLRGLHRSCPFMLFLGSGHPAGSVRLIRLCSCRGGCGAGECSWGVWGWSGG